MDILREERREREREGERGPDEDVDAATAFADAIAVVVAVVIATAIATDVRCCRRRRCVDLIPPKISIYNSCLDVFWSSPAKDINI